MAKKFIFVFNFSLNCQKYVHFILLILSSTQPIFDISGFLVFHIFFASGTWLKKGGREKESLSKKYSKKYQLQNTVWGYEKPSKGSKKQKDTAAVCKSKKFSEKVKKLYKCKERSTTMSPSKQQKTSDPLARCRDDNM